MELAFPSPQPGASLLLSFRLQNKIILIIGTGTLAASRAFAALEADAKVVVLGRGGKTFACEELRWRADRGEVELVDLDLLPGSSSSSADDIEAVEYYLKTTTPKERISFVCVTETIIGSTSRRSQSSAQSLYSLFKSHSIPVNITDMPDLCDFTFPSTHRFTHPSSGSVVAESGSQQAGEKKTCLQIGVTTNGRGCRLAGRIRREIVTRLPKEVGGAVEKVGRMREVAREVEVEVDGENEDSYEESGKSTPNTPVPQRTRSSPRTQTEETPIERTQRRMRWVAQLSEYWPLSKLAGLTDEDMREILSSESPIAPPPTLSVHSLTQPPPHLTGRVLLAGSGPGHPSLLTLATHTALTQLADLVLADKLVPSAVLSLIPPHVEIRIAKKFPGNAEDAQKELLRDAVEGVRKGLTVVRLKQGDPTIYGRAGEELIYLRSQGISTTLIPGVSSALAGPTFAGIPVTQRGAAESFVVCTGVGRNGKNIQLPGYERGRTVVVLMGVARIRQVVSALLDEDEEDGDAGGGHEHEKGSERSGRKGKAYPPHLPIAIIERASMPDQRIIESTLRDIVLALESSGEQRPPGMIVLGWSVLSLWGSGDMGILDEGAEMHDEERVRRWLGSGGGSGDGGGGGGGGGQGGSGGGRGRWRVREGLEDGWEGL